MKIKKKNKKESKIILKENKNIFNINTFNFKDVVVLSCGTSLNEYDKKTITNFCNGKFVICIKDAVFKYYDICNCFVANQHNDKDYNIDDKNFIKIYQADFQDPKFNNYDYELKNENFKNYGKVNKNLKEDDFDFDYYKKNFPTWDYKKSFDHWSKKGNYECRDYKDRLQKSLLGSKNFDKYKLSNQLGRPRGPGILYETVFYLCLELGFKNVYTIGWDLNTKGQSHFNKNDPNYIKYHEEFKFVNENIYDFYKYFEKNGMSIKVVGQISEVNRKIPRININKVKIPKIIHQTYKSYEIPECLLSKQQKLIEQNKNYKYKLYNDDDCKKILYDNFGFKAMLTFDLLKPGAFKADFFRYAILYLEGGVYCDIDLDIKVELDYLLKDNTFDLIVVNEKTSKYFDNKNIKIKGPDGYWNAFIIAKPKIGHFLRCMHRIIDNAINKIIPIKAESSKDYCAILSVSACVLLKDVFRDYKGKTKFLFFPETKNNEIHDENNVCIIVDNHDEEYNKVRVGYEEMYFNNNIFNSILCSLKKKYINKDCVILTCGKSLKEYESHFVKQFCKNKTVICVKEAIHEYEDICDIFVANEGRFRNYGLKKYQYLKILQKGNKNYKNITDLYDLYLHEETPHNMNSNDNRMLLKKNFNDYIFDNNLKRPWGPGIMYETVFYLCEFMGFSNVYTLGWDLISQSDDNITHYFEDYNNDYYKKSMRYNVRSSDFEYEKFYEGKEFKSEMKLVNDNLPFLYDFFKSKNMHINVLGNQSYVNKVIPRKNLVVNIIQFLNIHFVILPAFIEYFQSKSIVVNLYVGTSEISKITKDFKWVEFLKDHYNINVKEITDLYNDKNYSEFNNSLLTIFSSYSDIDYLYNNEKKIYSLYNKVIQNNNAFIVGHDPTEILKIKNRNIKSIAVTPRLKADYIINGFGKIKINSKEFNKNQINIACIGRCYKGVRSIDDILYVLEKYPNINIYMFTRINKIDDKFLEINKKFKNFKLLLDVNTDELYKILESTIHFITPFINVNNNYYETSFCGCYLDAINNEIPLIVDEETNNDYKIYSKQYNFIYKECLKETIEIISKMSNSEYRVLVEEIKEFYTKKSNENIETFKLLI